MLLNNASESLWLRRDSPTIRDMISIRSGIVFEDFFHFTARTVHYEGGAVASHARSLWRLETLRVV